MNPGTAISFDTNNLQTLTIETQDIQHENWPTRIAIPYILAHLNGSVIPFTEFSNKMIVLKGRLVGTGITNMDALADTFRGYFANVGRNLDIGYNGSTRRYVCTALDVQVTRPGGLGFAEFTVTLMCHNGFGQDTTATTLVNASGSTTAPRTDSLTIGGNAPQQLFTTTITLNSFTGSGSQSMFFGNNGNGQQVALTRTDWTAGDVMVFDCVNKVVTVNGIVRDFSGGFPEFPTGAQVLAYSDTFSARNINYLVTQIQRWL